MANDLIDPAELTNFPGAPFTADVVDAAAAAVRNVAGWHIAPQKTETLTVDGTCDCVLVLPTLFIGNVTEVRDVTDSDNPAVLDEWRIRKNSMLARDRGWPHRIDSVEVDLTHGYVDCPPDLLPVLAEFSQIAKTAGNISSRSLGDLSESYRGGGISYPNRSILARYRVDVR